MKETGYLLQAALIAAWWVGLASSDTFFSAFQFDQISSTAFWAFFAPDILLIATLSTVRAYYVDDAIEYVVLGAFGYAALYCLNASLLTASGFLPTGLMIIGMAYNILLCFGDSLFRVSSTNEFRQNALKTLIQVVCIWVLALVVIPYVILDSFPALNVPTGGIWLICGGLLFLAASWLGLTSAYFMVRNGGGTPLPLDQTQYLVVTGPYRFVRNPMAIAGISQGIGIAILFQSLPILVYALLGALIWHVAVRPIEERDLTNRFGEAYLTYKRHVSCWLPTIRQP